MNVELELPNISGIWQPRPRKAESLPMFHALTGCDTTVQVSHPVKPCEALKELGMVRRPKPLRMLCQN